MADADVVVLTKVPDEVEAAAIKALLAEEGIRCESNGEAIAGFRAEAPAMVRILVAAADADRARTLLQNQEAGASTIDWDDVNVGRPDA